MVMAHVLARVHQGTVPLNQHEVAWWLWARLRRAFPQALACVLMPNHLHLLTPTQRIDHAQTTMRSIISGLRRSSNLGNKLSWEPVPRPDPVPDRKHTRRLVRHLALNPCRAGCACDPLEWPWSTHRDAVGAIAAPWVDPARLAAAMGRSARGFAADHHRYVSAVDVAGTASPLPAAPTLMPAHPLADLAAAAAVATRTSPEQIRSRTMTRQLFLQLALRHGWWNVPQLSLLCKLTPRAIHQSRHRPCGPALTAAELCLGDARLRRWC